MKRAMSPGRICAVVMVVAALAWANVVPLSAHTVLPDIEYANVNGHSLRLDLYLPAAPAEDPVPLVLWVHGGAWRAGDKSPTYAPETLGETYAVASVNYRLTDEALFPAQIHDVKAAVRWLRAHAQRFGLDPDRFGAWGSSAGGHLVALLGVSCGDADLDGTIGEYLDESSCVQAICDYFGPIDLLSLPEQRGRDATRRPMPEDQLLGGPVEEHVELAALASPIAHIDEANPPFLILHGSEDPTVSVEQSISFDAALHTVGVDSTLIIVEGAAHGLPLATSKHVKAWFDAQFFGQAATTDRQGDCVFASHRNGQTFVTWPEGGGEQYAIYRTSGPLDTLSELAKVETIAAIGRDSASNGRASQVETAPMRYVIESGGDPLPCGIGLYVQTTSTDGRVHYTVARLSTDGVPIERIGGAGPLFESTAVPRPVLQSTRTVRGFIRRHYVHWAPQVDTTCAQALCNRPNQAFNFVVWEPAAPSGEPTAALFALHSGGGSYANALPLAQLPDIVVVSPDSVIPGDPEGVDRSWDAWYGYNDHVGTGLPLEDGINVDYTTRRLRWMVEWLLSGELPIDPNRLFLRGGSMGGIGTVFTAIMLRDLFAGGVATVPRFDYGADDVPSESFDTFATRWGSFEENTTTTDGVGIFDRLDAGFLATVHPEWSFAPVWAFSGRNDTAVGWSEKIPFYEAMRKTLHGWSFYWDLRAHGGRSTEPRAWRENGTEEEILRWIVANVRLDQSYPAFSNCSIDDDPGDGDPEDGDPVGTINGYLRWDTSTIEDELHRWSIGLYLVEGAPTTACVVDVTARRTRAFTSTPEVLLRYEVRSREDARLLVSGETRADATGRVTLPDVPVNSDGTLLIVTVQDP